MTDSEIIELYWMRRERAIEETEGKYGRYCYTVAYNVLAAEQDAEESVNDTWLAAWNAMPPTRPNSLRAFLGKLCRRIAVSRLRTETSQKRGGGETETALEELAEYLPAAEEPAKQVELRELTATINCFLDACPKRERVIFTARYFYVYSMDEIAVRLGMKPATVKTVLYRTRRRLMEQLKREGLL